jgi:light-regulated signal transduction histidine kinase (bacteriophytochrome)
MNTSKKPTYAELEQFAYICAHDLKEPLRAISSFTQLLFINNVGNFDDKSMEYITYILKSINRMDTLIKSILTYSQMPHMYDEYCEVELDKIIQSIKNDFVLLLYDVEGSIQISSLPTIRAHPIQMYQLFTNLISNAIKFRSQSPLVISISVTDHQTMWEVSIKDNGIGIDEEHYQHVFEVFKRLNSKEIYEGSGIGLATCKKIVEAHGGSISVHSNPAGGCEFKVSLPKANHKCSFSQ